MRAFQGRCRDRGPLEALAAFFEKRAGHTRVSDEGHLSALLALLASLPIPWRCGRAGAPAGADRRAANRRVVSGFKKRLVAAIEKRDRKFILGVLEKGVRSGLEGGRGVAESGSVGARLGREPAGQELGAVMALPAA